MTDQSQSWKTGSADPPRPANSTNPLSVCNALTVESLAGTTPSSGQVRISRVTEAKKRSRVMPSIERQLCCIKHVFRPCHAGCSGW